MATLTVLYDEECGVCTAAARWLEARAAGVEVAAIASARADHLLRDLEPADRYGGVHAVDRLGRRSTGGDAVAPILRALPHGRPAAALAAAFPAATGAGYRFLARRRRLGSRLLGLEACQAQ
jgi:predicted DCC family thiol-disulfide oxidoreductase YuxK